MSVGAQAALPYSRIGLTRLMYSFFMVGPSRYVNELRMRPSIVLAICLLPSPLVEQTLVHSLFAPQVSLFCGLPQGGIFSATGYSIVVRIYVRLYYNHMVLVVYCPRCITLHSSSLKRSCHFLVHMLLFVLGMSAMFLCQIEQSEYIGIISEHVNR